MVLCSAAWSWTSRAREREVIRVGEGTKEPISMRMVDVPSSAIMMLAESWVWDVSKSKLI